MKKNVFNLVVSTLTGIGIGIPVTLLCMVLIGGYNEVLREFLIWTAASALFGIITGLVFYGEQDWNLPVSMAVHCIGCLVVATAAAVICGYIGSFDIWLTAILPVFVVIYVAVYAFCIGMMKLGAQQVNQALEKE